MSKKEKRPRKPRGPKSLRHPRKRKSSGYQTTKTMSSPGVYQLIRNGWLLANNQSTKIYSSFQQSNLVLGNKVTPTNHSYVANEIRYPTGYWKRQWTYGFTDEYIGNLGTWGSIPTFANAGKSYDALLVRQRARQATLNYYEELKKSDNNLSIAIAEWQQTRKMASYENLTDIIRRFFLVVSRFKSALPEIVSDWTKMRGHPSRKERKRARSRLSPRLRRSETLDSVVSNTWLEMKYGWLPVLQEMHALVNFSRTFAFRIVVKGRSRSLVHQRNSFVYQGSPPGLTSEYITAMAEVKTLVQVDNPYLFDITRITSLNPVGWAYELLTLSFVIDWFIDIGSYIQALEQSIGAGLKFVHGYESTLYGVIDAGELRGSHKDSSGNVNSAYSCPYRETYINQSRVVLNTFPTPYAPSFEVKMGWQRCVSAAALLHQRAGQISNLVSWVHSRTTVMMGSRSRKALL